MVATVVVLPEAEGRPGQAVSTTMIRRLPCFVIAMLQFGSVGVWDGDGDGGGDPMGWFGLWTDTRSSAGLVSGMAGWLRGLG